MVGFHNGLVTRLGKPLVGEFVEQVSKFYNSSVEQIDQSKRETVVQVVDRANRWAKEAGFEQPILAA